MLPEKISSVVDAAPFGRVAVIVAEFDEGVTGTVMKKEFDVD